MRNIRFLIELGFGCSNVFMILIFNLFRDGKALQKKAAKKAAQAAAAAASGGSK